MHYPSVRDGTYWCFNSKEPGGFGAHRDYGMSSICSHARLTVRTMHSGVRMRRHDATQFYTMPLTLPFTQRCMRGTSRTSIGPRVVYSNAKSARTAEAALAGGAGYGTCFLHRRLPDAYQGTPSAGSGD